MGSITLSPFLYAFYLPKNAIHSASATAPYGAVAEKDKKLFGLGNTVGFHKKPERGMRTMDFDSINYFLSICTSGSFSEAAKRLYISQPTLSRRITALEDELGTELFSRKSTGISLTPAGKVFYEEQTKLMNSQFRLIEKMKSFRQEYAGTLNIGIREDLSYDLILRTAMYVKSVHPNLDIRIFAYSTNDLAERYIAGQIDIAFNLRDFFPDIIPALLRPF